MSSHQIPPSSGGKVATAFIAGAAIGALAVLQVAPAGVGADGTFAGEQTAMADEGGSADAEAGFDGSQDDGLSGSDTSEGLAVGEPGDLGTDSDGGGRQVIRRRTGGGEGATGGGSDGSSTDGGSGDAGGGGATGGSTSGGSTDGGGGASDSSISLGDGGGGGGSSVGSEGGTTSDCNSSNNGGATDTGITAEEIQVGATVVEGGPGASLLEDATVGMKAVIDKVNRNGGVCGRRIKLETLNDNWDPQTGRDYIRRFIEAGKFALVVVPSSEGLAEAIKGGMISGEGIPVVGTTGLRKDEYNDPWVFPVASATVSYMRSMAKYAYDDGARTYGIVWDNKYKFGIEGADAYKRYVASLPGATVKADVQVDPTKTNLSNEAQSFNQKCQNTNNGSGCDAATLLLVPQTAINWSSANSGNYAGRGVRTFGAQTLFTNDFAGDCGSWCDGMMVWTGYNPPLPPVDNKEGVREYVNDVKAVSSSVDARNQFVEGAYLGAQVFVAAVAQCSPKVTRACVKQALESGTYSTDLANELGWRSNEHHANKYAQAFSIVATGGSFKGWNYAETGWIRDPGL